MDFSAYKVAADSRDFITKHNGLCDALSSVVQSTSSGSVVSVDFGRNKITELGSDYVSRYNDLCDQCLTYFADSFADFRRYYPAVDFVQAQNNLCDALSAINTSIDPKPGTMLRELYLPFWDPTVSLDPRITFARASNASRFNHLGVLETVSSGVVRAHAYADHDPTTLSTSASSVSIGYGTKTFADTVTRTVGTICRATYDASNYIIGRVATSNGSSTTITVLRAVGSGTYASWTLIKVPGFRIEEQRTNSIRNNTMVGASAGTPGTLPTNWAQSGVIGTLTPQLVATGTANGIPYIDYRWSGTTSSGSTGLYFEGVNIAVSNGQSWTASAFVSVIAGSTSNLNYIAIGGVQRDSGGSGLSTLVGAISPSSSLRRYESTVTTNNASVAYLQPVISLNFNSGVAIDITLRIGLPQLEQGAFATSPILTSGSAATRIGDSTALNGGNFSDWYRQDEGSVVVEWSSSGPRANLAPGLVNIDDGTSLNRISLTLPGTSAVSSLYVNVNNVAQSDLRPPVPIAPGSRNKMAVGLRENSFAATTNGSAPVSDSVGSLPEATRMQIGYGSGGNPLDDCLIELSYYRQRLSNEQLQILSGAA